MASFASVLQYGQLGQYNRMNGTAYTKYHLSRAVAAHKMGWVYDVEMDDYQCPRCGEIYNSKEEIRNYHECEESTFTLEDFVPKEMKRMVPIPDLGDFIPASGHSAKSTNDRENDSPTKLDIVNFETIVAVEKVWNAQNEQIAKLEQLSAEERWALPPLDGSDVAFALDMQAIKEEYCAQTDYQLYHSFQPIPITKITIAGGVAPSEYATQPKGKGIISTTPKQRKTIVRKKQILSAKAIDNLIMAVAKIVSKDMKYLEIVDGSTKVKCSIVKYKGQKAVKVNTAHENNKLKSRDFTSSPAKNTILYNLAIYINKKQKWDLHAIRKGASGLVLPTKSVIGLHKGAQCGTLIVRGRYNCRIFDARSRLTHVERDNMNHYSAGELFWKGFEKEFVANRVITANHNCSRDLDVEQCGAVAAILSQAIFPCYKINCQACASHALDMTQSETANETSSRVNKALQTIEQKYTSFQHAKTVIDVLRRRIEEPNTNTQAITQVQRIIGDQTHAPFNHILRLNELLAKGTIMTQTDFTEASNCILELARFQKNRTDNIKAGSLASFRNKISAKSHINMALMCDNQLDINGNFKWGKRGYHAKRFFNVYFEQIEPTEGYDKYIVRKGPNGSRKLAIGKLILPTKLEDLRNHQIGESIKPEPLTTECVSKRGAVFDYPCCCVTYEDGSPMLSEVMMPTKNHLVVGNTGDSKYVDMPSELGENLYVAKQGYCYLNIFLAMSINLDEADAKMFTKTTRDLFISQLGEWPTLLDVSLACYGLTALYPQTKSAELPKILVDHKCKTMHVIDSYGSLTTGYHILKANTVAQLIKFGQGPLESAMMHYRVGGLTVDPNVERASVKTLIRGIYRPKVMTQVLQEEPFMLIMSLVSPGVLLALYNSGSLEKALDQWINQDVRIAMIPSLLLGLASKVSVARTINAQMAIINENAGQIYDNLVGRTYPYASHMQALELLQMIQARKETDYALTGIGFTSLQEAAAPMMEKIYLEDLEASWQELSWREKLSAILESRRWQKRISRPLIPVEESNLKGRYDVSPRSLFRHNVQLAKDKGRLMLNKSRATLHRYIGKSVCYILSCTTNFLPSFARILDIVILISFLLQILHVLGSMLQEHKRMKAQVAKIEYQNMLAKTDMYYHSLRNKLGEPPTEEELREYIQQVEPEVIEYLVKVGYFSEVPVEHQAKRESEAKLEQVVAFTALLLMLVDSERSDGVYKILSKLKGIMSSVDGPVYHQSLDDIKDTLSNKNQTIDIELDSDERVPTMQISQTFERWWSNQLARNRTIPHYRTEGYFMEFTRATAVEVANRIHGGTEKDILLRGAVGSGKSTGLPFHLSKRGSVLLLEPTKPLAENVYKQLRGDPFYRNPTLRFRGMNAFGSGSITIMTAGFALHYLANNVSSLKDYDFIIFDECHTIDASGMAFRSLLAEHEYSGKIIKVSATPPGREVEFTTQHPVKLIIEESLSFQQFVQNLGSKANSDVTQYGDNILVYVASYNEVDTLSKLLLDKHYKVTKVDGRTMKSGSMEIVTSGTSSKKHFVVATNIIENGVTLDIEVVVDFGLKVVPQLDVDNRMIRYTKKPISYGERIQRLGRVGRHKPGTALRIGTTEKSLTEIPMIAATEAALMCFAYGLPVMTDNVSPSLVNKCTVQQVRTMLQFELTPFFMVNLVRYDGTMHKAIHDLVKGYKLRDSEVILNKLANPFKQAHMWLTVKDYNKVGCNLTAPDETRIPFHCNDVPDKLYEQVWHAIQEYKADSCIGRVVCVNASKVAYTLQTDIHSLPRTIKILDHLIEEEGIKRAHFNAITENTFSRHNATLSGLINSVRSKYAEDHTARNLEILHAARAQLLEFSNIGDDPFTLSTIEKHPYTSCVYHQSTQAMAQHLQLQGKWNGSLITKDILIMLATLLGGSWLLYTWFRESWNQPVYHQGQNKRQRQKLKFRKARDQKDHYAFHGDDDVIAEHFGTAYTSYGKKKGTMHGTGKKIRKFVNMYGFDPSDFSVVRFVDPLTGLVLDESPYVDIMMVQEEIEKERRRLFDEGELDAQHMRHNKTIQAYYMKNAASGALKIDLTPHDPLVLGMRTNTIAGYPDREAELRQTGEPTLVKPEDVPKAVTQEVSHEAKSMLRGARDYNPIAQSICKLINTSEGKTAITYGIGYGSYIITNQHLFAHNNGELLIKSHKGEFTLKNTTVLKMLPCEGRDILILQMPKDMPPFPQKLNFRVPVANERVCLVGTNFQTKSTTSTVSESCVTTHIANSHFWKHWISTKDGDCGSPLVSTRDGAILGIHSLADCNNSQNYFVAFPEDFKTRYLDTQAHHEWVKHWRYKPDKICWGVLDIKESKADGLFKVSKLLSDLDMNSVYPQSARNTWLYDKLHGNLKAVAHCPSQLVTKHVVKGKCPLFETYLQNDVVAEAFFRPLMGEYGKSLLNKEAYIKDLFKYATPIIIGDVDTQVFENVVGLMVGRLRAWGMKTCQYVTDEMTIIQSLNMNSAVGALYTGKKRDYFDALSDSEKCQIVQDSCERLFNGKKGVWNGSLKAELRPQEKILANKTRTFTAAPLDTLLGGKVCVDDFNNQFYAMNLVAPWSVGMTKFYGGWDKLLRQLPDGWLYCDADGSQFDSSLSPYLINAVLQLRLSFMEKWDIGEQMLRNLYTEIVYTPISTPDGTLVKKFKGNNSGQPSTVVDNTLMVILAMHYSLLKLEIPITKQDEMCKYFVNGDDLLIAIDPTYEWVLDSLQGLFAQLGLKYEFNSRTKERTELWFMSHRGLLIDDLYIPKLEPERIVSILEWDRSTQPEHRIEAICAAMVESWGYTQLTHEIRRFYQWVLEQQPFAELCKQGKAPYIAESALRKLYTDVDVTDSEIARYLESLQPGLFEDEPACVYHQNDNIDAGKDTRKPDKSKVGETPPTPGGTPKSESSSQMVPKNQDKDINLGTSGTFVVPRIKSITAKMRVPKYKGQVALNVEHLLTYTPEESNLSNQIAKQVDFEQWCDKVMEELDITHDQFKIIANGWMAWCIDNGTSPNMSGEWIMMDGDEQITYPMKPFIEHAKPTLRQVMAHYSDVAETYIAMRNTKEVYIPRYARKRNMNDPSLAQYAFDFYVITSKTPNRAREMHAQMKAAALRNVNNKMFGLDGTVGRGDEDTERHTADDVNRNMHTLMGVRQM